MPITGLPTFTTGILTAASLNAIVTALEEKFSSKVTTGDFGWPLTAGGDINMGQYNILNVGKFWNAYDASSRAAGSTLQRVIDALEADGGGTVVFPGNYTEAMPQIGITVPAAVLLVGNGASSLMEIHSSANATMITMESGADNSGLMGLHLRGNASVNRSLVDVVNADNVEIEDVIFDTHGTATFLKISSGSINTNVHGCDFIGNGDTNAQNLVELVSSIGARFVDNDFSEWTDRAVYIQPAAASPVSGLIMSENRFQRNEATAAAMTATAAIYYYNSNSVASTGFIFSDNDIWGDASVGGIKIDGGGLVGVVIDGNDIRTNLTAPCIHLFNNTTKVVIGDNKIEALGGDGIVIGLDQGTEGSGHVASVVRGLTISGNSVYSKSDTDGDGISLLLAVSETSNGLRGSVTGNKFCAESADVISIWNVGTTRPLYLTICGNSAFPVDASRKGFSSFQGMGVTAGNIGNAAISWWFTMVANNIPGAVSGTDYTHSSANKCIVQIDNI